MKMFSRSLVVSGALAVTSLAGASQLQAQAAAVSRFHPDSASATTVVSHLNVLSRDRAVRWAMAGGALLCGPAPLTERPGIESEFARPRVAPLESAFADAARAKRSVASLRLRSEP
jgi:hypothetical protein